MMKTKLSIIAATTALILFSSCEKNSRNQEENTPTPIGFVNPRVVGSTKALDVVTTPIGGEEIGIFANINPATLYTFMSPNTKVTHSTSPDPSKWTYSPATYWPVDPSKTVNFFAYHPWSDQESSALSTAAIGTSKPAHTEGSFALTHWVNSAPAAQTDLLWDWVVGATKSQPSGALTNTSLDASTKLVFKHALSKIRFTTRLREELATTTKVYITSLTVNTNQKGILTTTSANTGESTIQAAAVNFPVWSVDNPIDFYVLGTLDNPLATDCPVDNFAPEGERLATTSVTDPKAFELLMLPNPDASITFTLNYDVVVEGVSPVKGVKVWNTLGPWIQGMQYTYHFVIGLDAITFTTSVGPWSAENVGDLSN